MWLKRAVEITLAFVLFPIAVLLLGAIAYAVGLEAIAWYLGAISTVWLLFAFVLPMLTGVMTPGEVVANVRWRMRSARYYEGELIPDERPEATSDPEKVSVRSKHFR